MPIYTYRCENCGVQFDRRLRFSDDPLKVCPECDEEALRKVFLPVGIVFKGSGFYSTDNRTSSGSGARAGKSSDSDSSSSSEKSESKDTDKKKNSEKD
jgi:putative FmdB family regulatory protein